MKGEEGLSATQSGFVLGAVLMGAPPALADRLLPAERGPCGLALAALSALTRDERSRRLALLLEPVTSPVPAGLERVHPGWLREALEPESSAVLRAIVTGLPAVVRDVATEIITARGEDPIVVAADVVSDEALAGLRRAVFAGFVPLPPGAPVVALDQLANEGAVVLGRSLQGAPRAVVARAAAGVGEPWARTVIATAAGPDVGRDQARALVASIRPDDTGLGAAHAIGLYALGTELAPAADDLCLAVAQQLPLSLGRVLIHARDRARGDATGATAAIGATAD